MKEHIDTLTRAIETNDDDAARAALTGILGGLFDLLERGVTALEKIADR